MKFHKYVKGWDGTKIFPLQSGGLPLNWGLLIEERIFVKILITHLSLYGVWSTYERTRNLTKNIILRWHFSRIQPTSFIRALLKICLAEQLFSRAPTRPISIRKGDLSNLKSTIQASLAVKGVYFIQELCTFCLVLDVGLSIQNWLNKDHCNYK